MSVWVGIDIGGTFTDVVAYTNEGESMVTGKVQSTPEDPSIAFMDGLELALKKTEASPTDVSRIVHGSTVAVNAFLERKGAVVGVLCTKGFEDVLAIGRAKRKRMYDLDIGPQTPLFLCNRERTVGLSTRLDPRGVLVDEASDEEIDKAIHYLVEVQNVESIALNIHFSYTNPSIEQYIADRIESHYPEIYVSRSSVIDPRFREYERLVVTALDAYIRPLVSRYVGGLRKKLHAMGITSQLLMMESHGGVLDAQLLSEQAVTVLMSGLAGGAIGAAKTGTLLGHDHLLSIDMGGTSTDVSLITDGAAVLSDEGTIGDFDMRLPMVDVHTIGAGGGSIAQLDASNSLRVGPDSAGADPGPVCYQKGGRKITVTDANLILGYVPSEKLADGTMSLTRDVAVKALQSEIAEPLGLSVPEAAWAVHRVAIAGMANAARVVSIKRGIDVRNYALFPGGGAGPMHACGIADELGIDRIVVPPFPGVLAAYGLLAADSLTNIWKTFRIDAGEPGLKDLKNTLIKDVRESEIATKEKGSDITNIETRVFLGMRYIGQAHELDVEVNPQEILVSLGQKDLSDKFDALHHARYGQTDTSSGSEITGYKIRTAGYRNIPLPKQEKASVGSRNGFNRSTRFFNSSLGDFVEAPVLARQEIFSPIAGPAIIEQPDCTIVVQPDWTVSPGYGGLLTLQRVTPVDKTDKSVVVSNTTTSQ